MIFFKNSAIYFSAQCYSTNQKKQIEFFQHWNQQAVSCHSSLCYVGEIEVQKLAVIVATNQMLNDIWIRM